MSANSADLYKLQYSQTLNLLLQQKGSKLEGTVTVGSHQGKQASPVDQMAAVSAQLVVGRFNPMGRVDAQFDRRWVFPKMYELPQLFDNLDKIKMMIDPKSSAMSNSRHAMGRAKDDEIIAAFFGTAKTGVDGSTSTTFLSANQVAATVGAASATGLNVKKLREGKKILMSYEVDLDADPLYCIVSAKQHDDLLAEATVISTDYNDRPVLVDGKLTRFLGINFIHSERLPVNGSSYRRCPLYAKSGMYLGMFDEVSTDISQRKDISGLPWQIYDQGVFGATRLEEKKVVELICAES